MDERKPDPAAAVSEQIREVRCAFKAADEVYRIFRVLVVQYGPPEVGIPQEWVPFSKH